MKKKISDRIICKMLNNILLYLIFFLSDLLFILLLIKIIIKKRFLYLSKIKGTLEFYFFIIYLSYRIESYTYYCSRFENY